MGKERINGMSIIVTEYQKERIIGIEKLVLT